jgi:hypothetical protein
MIMRREQPSGLDGVVFELIATAYFCREPLPYSMTDGSFSAPSGRD